MNVFLFFALIGMWLWCRTQQKLIQKQEDKIDELIHVMTVMEKQNEIASRPASSADALIDRMREESNSRH